MSIYNIRLLKGEAALSLRSGVSLERPGACEDSQGPLFHKKNSTENTRTRDAFKGNRKQQRCPTALSQGGAGHQSQCFRLWGRMGVEACSE